MSTLKTIDRQPFEDLFDMAGGYVLHPYLTNPTFQSFFAESVGIDIYSDRYAKYGDSKAKRLRAFWEVEPDQTVAKVLSDLVELWEYKNPKASTNERTTAKRCRQIIDRLNGRPQPPAETTEKDFLEKNFKNADIAKVPIEASLIPILEVRFIEAGRSLDANAPLAAIFMCGSVLEGLLLGTALANPRQFNQASCAPKDTAKKVKPFPEWSLAQLIDVACELGYLKVDVKKFSHALRDFRNYIHPYQQMSSQFAPDKHTAEICMQVLRAAIASLSGGRNP